MLRSRLVWVSTLCALAGGAGALADVDVQVLSGDKVTGSVTPAAETETFRMLLPAGASFSCKVKGAKKNGVAVHAVFDPAGNDPAVTGTEKGLAATVPATVVTRSGNATLVVTSRDGAGTGAYSLSAKWTVRKKWPFAVPSLAALSNETLAFGADKGAVVRCSVAKSKVAGVVPQLVRIDGPDGYALDLTGMTASGDVTLPETADYTLVFTNAGGTAGRVSGSVNVKPPKTKPRKIDVSSAAIGGGGDETAIARIVGSDGGAVAVPDLGLGGGLDDISGSSVSIPAGALSFPTSIVVGTAPAITVASAGPGLGPAVFFGPEGLTFGTKSAPIQATLQIPVDLSLVGNDANELAIYVRDAKGKVTLVPGPYDTTTNPGFATFPANHFSSYRGLAKSIVPAPTNPLTLTSVAGALKIVPAPASFGPDARGFICNAQSDTIQLFRFATGSGASLETWVGGGAQTADGTHRSQFDLQGPPTAVAVLSTGTMFVGTPTRVFRVDSNGLVTRIVGTGTTGDMGDNGPGAAAQIQACNDLLPAPNNGVYIVDNPSARVRNYQGISQQIVTEFGTGVAAIGTDGTQASSTSLVSPTAITFGGAGMNFLVADGTRIRALDRGQNINFTVAGDPAGSSGTADAPSGPTNARFRRINAFTYDQPGKLLYVADDFSGTIRLVDLNGAGSVRTIAGIPDSNFPSPDGTVPPFTLNSPLSVFPFPVGSSTLLFLEADSKIRTYTFQ